MGLEYFQALDVKIHLAASQAAKVVIPIKQETETA